MPEPAWSKYKIRSLHECHEELDRFCDLKRVNKGSIRQDKHTALDEVFEMVWDKAQAESKEEEK